MNTNQSFAKAVESPRANVTTLAWGVIVIGSMAPTIILRLFVPAGPAEPVVPSWLVWTQVVALAVLWAVSWVWPTVKPLRGLVLALLAFWIGVVLFTPLVFESATWSNWVQQASWGVREVADRFGNSLIPVVLMALTLIGSGIGRRELFLARGNPSALAQPTRLLGLKEPKPWNRVARDFLIAMVIITGIVAWLQYRPDVSQIPRALRFLPAIAIATVITVFAEEFMFRSVLLARLEPVVRPGQAMLMTAVLFGSLHYYTGAPSGPIGALVVTWLGWVNAKSMIETRGLVWAFLIHFVMGFVVAAVGAISAA
jgi:membrane protease YdiL (CAAX protease family)